MNLLLTIPLSLFQICVPVAEMREQANQESEIVSQAYYSESINVIEKNEDWIKIETSVDHYQGWTKKSTLCPIKQSSPHDLAPNIIAVDRCAAHVYHTEDTIYGPMITLPFESHLELLSPETEMDSRWLKVRLVDDREGFIQRGDVTFRKRPLTRNEMCLLSLRFLDTPYTWGGRSSFGYDCSGFTQMLYRQMGVLLPRDSKDQILWEGFQPVALDKLQSGDLVFFGTTEGEIQHVAMSLGEDRIIHSTVGENAPHLRISRLSDAAWSGEGKFKFCTARTLR